MHILATLLLFGAFTFADIPRGTPVESVVKQLKAAGYKDVKKTKTAVGFKGTFFGHEGGGVANLAGNKLASVIVIIPAAEDTARETYTEIRSTLAAQYGQPAKTVAKISEPFHEGDGYEAEAIRSGKGTFATQWVADDGKVTIGINTSLAVVITYE